MAELKKLYGGFCVVEDGVIVSHIYRVNADKMVAPVNWTARSFRKGCVTWHDYEVTGHSYNNIKTMISNGSLKIKED